MEKRKIDYSMVILKNPESSINCLICESTEIDLDIATIAEELQLFQQLVGQNVESKIKIDEIGFCKKCKESLHNYKKLKISCIRAWKKNRDTQLTPVIMTKEMKLFRIEDPQPVTYTTAAEVPEPQSRIIMEPMINPPPAAAPPKVVSKPSPAQIMNKKSPVKREKDPLRVETKITQKRPEHHHSPYPKASPSRSLILQNFCYICQSVKSNLNKHLVLAHCLYDMNYNRTCNVCKEKYMDEESFIKHFSIKHFDGNLQLDGKKFWNKVKLEKK